jgi:hypothetical protein
MRRSGRSPTRRAVLEAQGRSAASLHQTRSQYQAPPASGLTRPADAVLPGGVATRRPPPPAAEAVSSTTSAVSAAARGVVVGLVGGYMSSRLFSWLPRAPDPSDMQYGGYGALAGSGLYVALKALGRARPRMLGASAVAAAGAMGGLALNTLRLEAAMQDWTEERDEAGSRFYHNFRTGASQWDRPSPP